MLLFAENNSFSAGSGCNGDDAYACADQSPWAINDTFSYGFVGAFIMEHASNYWCCACYELTFTSGAVKGKKMVVQAHNSAYEVATANRFALAVSLLPSDFSLFFTSADLSGRSLVGTLAMHRPARRSMTFPVPFMALRSKE